MERTLPIHTIQAYAHLLVCFFPFGCIWNRFGTPRNSKQNGTNWCNKCKSSCRDVFLEYFTVNTPDPHHWTLNTCFGAFLPVWVHLEPFRYYTKLEAKRDILVQLMQQFVPWCFVRIFHNERNQSTPLDPKLMFWCIALYLGAFGNVSLLHETRCKTCWTSTINAEVRDMMSYQNFSQRMHPSPTH